MNIHECLTNEEYDFIFDRIPRLSIDLIITSKKGILLSLRDIDPFRGMWHLPGGTVYKDESIKEAAERIARAETGLDIKVNSCAGYIEYMHATQNNHDRHTVSIVLAASPLSEELHSDYQAQKIQFHSSLPDTTIAQQKKFLIEHTII